MTVWEVRRRLEAELAAAASAVLNLTAATENERAEAENRFAVAIRGVHEFSAQRRISLDLYSRLFP